MFAAWTPDGRCGVISGHRLLGRTAWYWAAMAEEGQPLLHITEWSAPVRHDPFIVKAEQLWAEHTCDAPLEQWSIGNECYATAIDDPDDAFGRAYGRPMPIGFDLEWYATGAPVDIEHGFEQVGVVHGVVELIGRAGQHFTEVPAHRWRRWTSDATGFRDAGVAVGDGTHGCSGPVRLSRRNGQRPRAHPGGLALSSSSPLARSAGSPVGSTEASTAGSARCTAGPGRSLAMRRRSCSRRCLLISSQMPSPTTSADHRNGASIGEHVRDTRTARRRTLAIRRTARRRGRGHRRVLRARCRQRRSGRSPSRARRARRCCAVWPGVARNSVCRRVELALERDQVAEVRRLLHEPAYVVDALFGVPDAYVEIDQLIGDVLGVLTDRLHRAVAVEAVSKGRDLPGAPSRRELSAAAPNSSVP